MVCGSLENFQLPFLQSGLQFASWDKLASFNIIIFNKHQRKYLQKVTNHHAINTARSRTWIYDKKCAGKMCLSYVSCTCEKETARSPDAQIATLPFLYSRKQIGRRQCYGIDRSIPVLSQQNLIFVKILKIALLWCNFGSWNVKDSNSATMINIKKLQRNFPKGEWGPIYL